MGPAPMMIRSCMPLTIANGIEKNKRFALNFNNTQIIKMLFQRSI
jgi:hypothetical protein